MFAKLLPYVTPESFVARMEKVRSLKFYTTTTLRQTYGLEFNFSASRPVQQALEVSFLLRIIWSPVLIYSFFFKVTYWFFQNGIITHTPGFSWVPIKLSLTSEET